jgi:argininosuccinate synthase
MALDKNYADNYIKKIKASVPPGEYSDIKKVVIAYSGGTDTSILVKILREAFGFEVVTLTLDFGQEEYKGSGLEKMKQKALSLGACKAVVKDLKADYVKDYVSKAIMANCLYEGAYVNSSAIGRYLIAEHLVKAAKEEGAQAVVHGSTGKGNDQVRFDVSINTLDPSLKIIAPVRDWGLNRDEEYIYAEAAGIPLPTKKTSPYSVDANLWGRSAECGIIEHPDCEVPQDALAWVTPAESAPDKSAVMKLTFDGGVPVKMETGMQTITGTLEVITALNTLAGIHGVGIVDHMEDRTVGLKSREFYEAPAATAILTAHKDLEKYVLTKEENLFKPMIDAKFAELAYTGLWYSPLMGAINAFVEATQEKVTGWVKLKLYKGSCQVLARDSPCALYSLKLATYDKGSTYNQKDALGFIKLWGLNTVLAAQSKKGLASAKAGAAEAAAEGRAEIAAQ